MKLCLRYRSFFLATLLFVGAVLMCAASASHTETLVIAGNGTSGGVMRVIAREFKKKRPDVNVKVLPSIGSAGGIKAVTKDKIDIGLSNRPLKRQERRVQIIEKPYGRTAFVFGVEESNPATGFTLAEIEGIYTQKLSTWPDGTPIRPILRPQGDSCTDYLASITPGLKAASEKAYSIAGVCIAITDQEAAAQIEKTAGSFGTTVLCLAASEKRKIKALSVDGISPTLANVSTGKYPYFMTLSLVYKKDKYKGALKDFIEFVFSKDGQKILKDNELVIPKPVTKK